MQESKIRVLFLCTGNSCRSQMAEGWARQLCADSIDPHSAGLEAHGLNPDAVSVMAEVGVDITGQFSKTVDELASLDFDFVVTVCGHAHESCPIFPGHAKIVHVAFEDPPALAAAVEGRSAQLDCYRRVREEIRVCIAQLPQTLLNSR